MREEGDSTKILNGGVLTTTPSVSGKAKRVAALFGFLVTIGLFLALLAPRLFRQGSAFAVFNQVKLTMPRGQVQDLLRSGRIACRWSGTVSSSEICAFSDFWREYRLAINAQ